MGRISLTDRRSFSSRRFLPELLYGSDRARIFLLCLQPGQGLPVRADSEEMLCYVVEGKATLTIGAESLTVCGGDLSAAEAGQVRGIEAQEPTTVLWIHIGSGAGEKRG